MRETDSTTRRRVLKIAGAAGATAFVAGCTDGGNGNGEEPAEENGEEPAEENGAEEEENGEEMENGEAIEPDTRIVLFAETAGWQGEEPEEIADEENPTLTLQDGESYEIGWEEGDGQTHNIELVDENDEVVDDYQTDEAEEGGDDQFIEFDASDDIAEYVCRPHEGTMRGTIEIETNGNGAAEDENGEDENGEDTENGEDENGEDTENGEDENGEDTENGEDQENGEDENGEDEENN